MSIGLGVPTSPDDEDRDGEPELPGYVDYCGKRIGATTALRLCGECATEWARGGSTPTGCGELLR